MEWNVARRYGLAMAIAIAMSFPNNDMTGSF